MRDHKMMNGFNRLWMKGKKIIYSEPFLFSHSLLFLLKNNVRPILSKWIFFFYLSRTHKRFIDFLWWSCSLSPTYGPPIRTNGGWKKIFSIFFYLFKKMSHVPHFFFFFGEKKIKKRSKRSVVFVGFSSPLLPCTCRCSPFFSVCVCILSKRRPNIIK